MQVETVRLKFSYMFETANHRRNGKKKNQRRILKFLFIFTEQNKDGHMEKKQKKKQQQLVLKIKGAARKRQAERRESDWSGSEKRLREFKVMEKDERKYYEKGSQSIINY